MALPRSIDAIGPVQAGVEPLRRIGRGDLARQHEAHFVVIGARVVFAVEIAALPAPIGPGAGEPVEHLPRRGLGDIALGRRQRLERGLVGNGAPQERGNVVLLDALQPRGHAGFAEIFLCQHVGRDLAPAGGNLDPVSQEHHRSVGIADLALGRFKRDRRISGVRTLGVVTFDAHKFLPSLPRHPSPPSGPRTEMLGLSAGETSPLRRFAPSLEMPGCARCGWGLPRFRRKSERWKSYL